MAIEYVKRNGQALVQFAIPKDVYKNEPAKRAALAASLPLMSAADLRALADDLDRRNAEPPK